MDVTDKFPDAVKAEQDGKNVLILTKLDPPAVRYGKKYQFLLEYRWLSDPESVVSVQGNDFTYWQNKEVNMTKGLFDQFRLFP